jgi:hypothetical protein
VRHRVHVMPACRKPPIPRFASPTIFLIHRNHWNAIILSRATPGIIFRPSYSIWDPLYTVGSHEVSARQPRLTGWLVAWTRLAATQRLVVLNHLLNGAARVSVQFRHGIRCAIQMRNPPASKEQTSHAIFSSSRGYRIRAINGRLSVNVSGRPINSIESNRHVALGETTPNTRCLVESYPSSHGHHHASHCTLCCDAAASQCHFTP